MRSEIEIPRGGYGAEVFANEVGGITISQSGFAGEAIVGLTVDEARLVANGLREVAAFLEGQKSGGEPITGAAA